MPVQLVFDCVLLPSLRQLRHASGLVKLESIDSDALSGLPNSQDGKAVTQVTFMNQIP